LDLSLLDAVVRLVRLVEVPADASFLLPMIRREIIYKLLIGEQGERLRRMSLVDGHTTRIARAVEDIRRRYDNSLRIEALASRVGMSVSGFHHHFKAVTAMTPLRFRKQLRLREARRLMLGERFDAATADSHVGYGETSHFNRDYKRFFGDPPIRDIERIRKVGGGIEVNAP
jgi:AraC-like DNA-binding protein